MDGIERCAGPIESQNCRADPGKAEQFCYQPLLEDHATRLLVLEPGQRNEPLIGIIKVINLEQSDIRGYEALSYVWGTDSGAHKMLVHSEGTERSVRLTTNVYEALRRLRLPNQQRSLWVDQICIDQDNLKERSHQVQFMNQIYRHAGHVLVWLGLDANNIAEKTFQFISKLDRTFQDDEMSKNFHIAHTKELEKQSRDSWVYLDHLMELDWFHRGWIAQEIGTTAPATLIWGEAEIDWVKLCRICQKLQNYYDFRSKFKLRTDEVRYLYQRFVQPSGTRKHDNRFNFIYELHRARRLKFSDERDRIFAWLGHFSLCSSNKELGKLEANYNQTLVKAYIEVVKRALTGEKGNSDGAALVALAAVQHISLQVGNVTQTRSTLRHKEEEKLPSWVSDWRIFRSFMLTEPASPLRAHGNSPPKLEVYDDPPLLRIHGLEIDTVQACSRCLGAREFHRESIPTDLEPTVAYLWHDICHQDNFNLSSRYLNGESAFFAYMQTLGNGCVQIAKRENTEYKEVSKPIWLEHAAMYLLNDAEVSKMVAPDLRKIAEKAKKEDKEEQWGRCANGASENRIFARTRGGYYVLGPGVMEVGDIICVLFGGKLPFCLRPRGEYYLLVGECYVYGLMEGEAIRMADQQELSEKVFEIV